MHICEYKVFLLGYIEEVRKSSFVAISFHVQRIFLWELYNSTIDSENKTMPGTSPFKAEDKTK